MADINAIAEQIQGLTLLEASQLVKLLEEKLGVSAAAAAPVAAAGGAAAAAPAVEEKTEFTVVLTGAGASQNHREFCLLLDCRSRCRRAAGCRHRRCRCRRDAQLLFEQLDELRGLEQRQALNLFRNCVNVRHFKLLCIRIIEWGSLATGRATPWAHHCTPENSAACRQITPRTCFPSRPDLLPPPSCGRRH